MGRSYTTAGEVIPHLERIIRNLRDDGQRFLPSERQLQEQVGASRMTLRKALEMLEGKGVLVKESRGRVIDGVRPVREGATMVSAGWDFPGNPVWLRLSLQLEKRLAEKDLTFRQILYGYDEAEKIWPGPLAKLPEILIYTDAPNEIIREHILAQHERCILIATDEDYIGMTDYVVSLNNYQAGRLAGETLLQQGCKNPAMIYWDSGYVPFMKRRNGFGDALKRAGVKPDGAIYGFYSKRRDIRNLNFVQELHERVESVVAAGHDGLFVWSDENIHSVYDCLTAHLRIPEEFALITLDGCGECRSNSMIIDAVSHNTDGMAQALADLTEKLVLGQPHEKITLINTEVFHGKTGRR